MICEHQLSKGTLRHLPNVHALILLGYFSNSIHMLQCHLLMHLHAMPIV